MEEKPGVTPMLETIMPRSSGATSSRMISSTCATSLFGDFDPRAGGRLEIDDELAGVGAGK